MRDVAAVYWGDAMDSAIRHRARVREEKASGVRPTATQRAKRFGQMLWRPVGESAAPAAVPQPARREPGIHRESPDGHAGPTPDDARRRNGQRQRDHPDPRR